MFSMMSLDQLHEQNNWTIKSSVTSIFVNKADYSAFVWWETCGLEVSRIIIEFEATFWPPTEDSNSYHKNSSNFASKLYKDIKTLHEALPVNLFMFENETL